VWSNALGAFFAGRIATQRLYDIIIGIESFMEWFFDPVSGEL
jgi:hypothetical protein